MILQLCIVKDCKAKFTLRTSTRVDVPQKDARPVVHVYCASTCGDAH